MCFVDATYLLKMRELKDRFPQLQKDYESVTNHVKRLDAEGHAIQLHLHPQWCYSSFNGSKWVLDKDHYKLSDMPLEEQKKLIHEGVQLLNSLVTRKVTAFRAGGYSVENFPDLYDTFLEEGIVADSSVLRGEHYESKYQTYDYRNIPALSSYRFSTSHKVKDDDGRMIEYPLSVKITPFFMYLVSRIVKRKDGKKAKKKWGDGVGIGYPGGKQQMILTNLKMLTSMKSIPSYIEYGYYLEDVYKYSVSHFKGEEFVIIGHRSVLVNTILDCWKDLLLIIMKLAIIYYKD